MCYPLLTYRILSYPHSPQRTWQHTTLLDQDLPISASSKAKTGVRQLGTAGRREPGCQPAFRIRSYQSKLVFVASRQRDGHISTYQATRAGTRCSCLSAFIESAGRKTSVYKVVPSESFMGTLSNIEIEHGR